MDSFFKNLNRTFYDLGHVGYSNTEASFAAFGSDWWQLFAIRKHDLLDQMICYIIHFR